MNGGSREPRGNLTHGPCAARLLRVLVLDMCLLAGLCRRICIPVPSRWARPRARMTCFPHANRLPPCLLVALLLAVPAKKKCAGGIYIVPIPVCRCRYLYIYIYIYMCVCVGSRYLLMQVHIYKCTPLGCAAVPTYCGLNADPSALPHGVELQACSQPSNHCCCWVNWVGDPSPPYKRSPHWGGWLRLAAAVTVLAAGVNSRG